MWSKEAAFQPACNKIAHLIVGYTRGQGLDIGCGRHRCWPHFIGVEKEKFFTGSDASIKAEPDRLLMVADGSMDFVFSSFSLQYSEERKNILAEWGRVIKENGYLVLYLPKEEALPKKDEDGYDPDIKEGFETGQIERILKMHSCGWTQVECEDRSQRPNEYGIFEVYKKRADGKFVKDLWQRHPNGKNRAIVIRYGAIGDHIVAASVLPELKKQGYHITYHAVPMGYEVLKHDPHIDEWLIEDKDQIPNMELGPFWEALRLEGRYDKIVNLCESMEVSLLAVPGRIPHGYSDEARRKLYGKTNYLEYIHDIADVPYEFHQKFYATDEEKKWAGDFIDTLNAPVVVWAINGSSHHKVYPFTQIVSAWLLERTPAHIFMVSGEDGKSLQDGIMKELKKNGSDMSRVHGMAKLWTIRQSLSFASMADVVVGPETGILNGVAFEQNRKVIYLSHSNHENLTKHWRNTAVMTADQKECPCSSCHRLHYNWEFCVKDETTQAALCASVIKPENIFREIVIGLGATKITPLLKAS